VFEACGKIDCLTHRVVPGQAFAVAGDGDDLAGIEAHPYPEASLFGVEHCEGGGTSPNGVILLRQGGAEERHQSVPHDRRDGAAMPASNVCQLHDSWLHKFTSVFWIETSDR